MTKDKRALFSVLVLVLPMLVLAGVTFKAGFKQQVGQQVWQIKITGYDPRDLLYGHFLRYQYDWNTVLNPHTINEIDYGEKETCLCLNESEGDGYNPVVYRTYCKAPQNDNSCASVLKVFNHGQQRYSFNRSGVSEKYFIPEEKAKQLDRLFRRGEEDFKVELMAHKDQSSSIRGLYVNDVLLDAYLRSMPQEAVGQ